MKQRRSLASLVGAAALSLLLVAPAIAAPVTDGIQVEVTPGTLSVSNVAAGDFAPKSLTGLRQTTTGTLGFTVTDARGSGAGYNVTATASLFTAGGIQLGDDLLAIGEMEAVVQGGEDASESPAPVDMGASVVLDGVEQTGVTILTASADEGMGVYTVTDAPLTLVLPADTEVGTYTSTITIDAAAI